MKRLTVVAMLFGSFLVALALAPKANADQYNKKSVITFTEPFEVPGVDPQILPAGTYVFKLVDSMSDRNIVRIFNEDETHVFTTILAIDNFRLKPTDKSVITFEERGEGQPQAIKAWFYPDEAWGQEFVYSKKRAIELAKIVKEPVLEISTEPATLPVATLRSVPLAAVEPTGEEVPVATVAEAPPAAEKTVVAENLPQTASPLPLYGLIGLLSLGIGFALLIVTKRAG
jgi:hypothetical protein